jgi:hypothetical protein
MGQGAVRRSIIRDADGHGEPAGTDVTTPQDHPYSNRTGNPVAFGGRIDS